MKIDKKEVILLEAEEENSWARLRPLIRDICLEVSDDEIKKIASAIDDYMEMLEKYIC